MKIMLGRLCKCACLLWLVIQDTSARIFSCFVFRQFAIVVCWHTIALMLAGNILIKALIGYFALCGLAVKSDELLFRKL